MKHSPPSQSKIIRQSIEILMPFIVIVAVYNILILYHAGIPEGLGIYTNKWVWWSGDYLEQKYKDMLPGGRDFVSWTYNLYFGNIILVLLSITSTMFFWRRWHRHCEEGYFVLFGGQHEIKNDHQMIVSYFVIFLSFMVIYFAFPLSIRPFSFRAPRVFW